MNRAEKEAYLREYEQLKKQGKPFFPYAVMKDSTMALIVVLVIALLAIVLGAEQGPKADPTTTTYTPRPDWYFFFLFELLRVLKPPYLVPLATIGIPTIAMILLFLLPFYDRGAERRPERRPVAMTAMAMTIVVMAYLTYAGANAGPPTSVDINVPQQYEPGKLVVGQSACLACHKIADSGNGTLAPNLTHIGSRIPREAILRSLKAGPSIMPSFKSLGQKKLNEVADFLSYLK
ncbi:MAG TPA: c-type cytochrome [Solirubrobacteraceae bacterium]|nr:c-type cytochrome [Solirubrobacteraceae bacterium]